MAKLKIYSVLIGLVVFSLTANAQIIRNKARLNDIQRMLAVQQRLTSHGRTDAWSYLRKNMPVDEKQALRFMYAYMPLSDIADYSPSFIDENVKYALKARAEMPWGKCVPEDEFLHFVLPLRVNNENLDSFRKIMYAELKARVNGLSMKEAVLEINHWCHEKVTYRGTDARTSAPLSTVKKSFGRCGEESTFTVTALRTIGIPARQVYTPRWAHTDDNHAWVEVWVDGKWYYLGACEPDADLNMGWFSEPATRAMLVHTRAYGRYFGKEDAVVKEDRFSELNLTSHYAPVKKILINVKDANGRQVDSAKVEFKLYNYAEYYPIAVNYTKNGSTYLTTGDGDLLVWASYKGTFGYAKLSVRSMKSLDLVLDKTYVNNKTEDYVMVPPKTGKVETHVTDVQMKENSQRLQHEDSIRNAYMHTFKDSVWAEQLASRLKLDPKAVKEATAKSYGNWSELEEYLVKGVKINRQYVLKLLQQLSDKDFSDMKAYILLDHLSSAKPDEYHGDADTYVKYVLAPRMDDENLSTWRSFLAGQFSDINRQIRNNVSVLTKWIIRNIKIDDIANRHSRAPISPEGVFRLRVSDDQSRDLFFVAVCRSMGIPARLNSETLEPEYLLHDDDWEKVSFSPHVSITHAKGYLHLFNGTNLLEPQYYLHFTVARLQNGTYQTLDFDEEKKVTQFPQKIALEAGYYALVTGNRQSDGSVLSSITYFKIAKDSTTQVKVELQQYDSLRVSGQLMPDSLFLQAEGANNISLSSVANGAPTVLVVIDPDKEPSKHILNDLVPYRDIFGKTNVKFIFVASQSNAVGLSILKTYALPGNYLSGVDIKDNIYSAVVSEYGTGAKDKLPLVLLYDSTGAVYYFSSGYQIGVGEQLLKVIMQMEKTKSCDKLSSACFKN